MIHKYMEAHYKIEERHKKLLNRIKENHKKSKISTFMDINKTSRRLSNRNRLNKLAQIRGDIIAEDYHDQIEVSYT